MSDDSVDNYRTALGLVMARLDGDQERFGDLIDTLSPTEVIGALAGLITLSATLATVAAEQTGRQPAAVLRDLAAGIAAGPPRDDPDGLA